MNADYPCKEETETIIGCAFAVLNEIGQGYHEKPYENSLAVEFEYRGIPYVQQTRIPSGHCFRSKFHPPQTRLTKGFINVHLRSKKSFPTFHHENTSL